MSLQLNLDHEAALAAQHMLQSIGSANWGEAERLIRKTLGVVQENGVYAGTLFLLTRPEKEKPIAGKIVGGLFDLLLKVTPEALKDTRSVARLAYLTGNVTGKLQTLLLVKSLWEQALIYARYGAKL
jgi:hypothetical protein